MKTNDIKKNYPKDFQEIPNQDRISGVFGHRYSDKKTFDIPISKLAKDLNLSSSGGAPILFYGNELPILNSIGGELKKGDWVLLESGILYKNINGGPDIYAPINKVSYAQFDGDHWGLIKISDIPDSSAKIDEWTPNFWVKDTVKTYLGDIYRAKQDTDTVPVNELFWDKIGGTTNNLNISFGGVIDDTYDLSTPPTDPTWYIASPGTYNTTPPTTLTETSILTWNGQSWSHIPFELEVRGEFLVADNIQEVRNITPQVAQLLVNGTYKGVTVLGYYNTGDTPAPIQYFLSTTSKVDDGGSVIVVGDIKLEHDFKGVVDVRYFGIFNDHDNTQRLQNVININQGSFIYFNDLNYFIDGTLNNDMGIIVPSNTHISQSENSVFKIKPNNQGKYGGFTFNGSLNYVSRLVVKGERSQHLNPVGGTWNEWLPSSPVSVGEYIVKHAIGYKVTQSGTTGVVNNYINSSSVTIGQVFNDGTAKLEVVSRVGEWGMGVNLINAKGVKIDYLQCDDCWGDGLYLGKSEEGLFSEDIYIGKLYANNNRRQGISFITGKNILIDYAKITNTKGVAPSAGIDFESNHATDRLDGIVINKLETANNDLCGVLFDPQKLNNTSTPVDIKINSWSSYNERAFRTLGDQPTHVVGKIVIKGLTSFNAPMMAIEVRNYYNAPDITFENPLVLNPNETNRSDSYGSGIMVYKDQTDAAPVEGHYSPYIQIINPTVIDNRTVKRMYHGIVCYSYRSAASFIKNVKILNPTIMGNVNSPVSYNSNLNIEDGLNNLVKVMSSDQVFNHNTNNYKTFSNSGETVARTITLSGTYSSNIIKIKVDSAQPLIVSIGSGSLLTLNVNTIQSSQVGAELELECVNPTSNLWKVVRGIGTWTSGNKTFRFSNVTEATTSISGTVKQGIHVPNGSSIDILLSSLRSAGIIASS